MRNNGDHSSDCALLGGEIVGNSNLRIMLLCSYNSKRYTELPTKSETVQCVTSSMVYFKTPNLVQAIEWNGNVIHFNHEGDGL